MQQSVRVLALVALLAAPAHAQMPPQQQEQIITFSLPRSQAKQLEEIVGAVPSGQAAYLYVAIQSSITATLGAQQQAQIDAQIEAFKKGILEQDAKERAAKEAAAPKVPPPVPAPVPDEEKGQ